MCKLQKHLIQMNSVDGGRRGEKEGFIFWLLFSEGYQQYYILQSWLKISQVCKYLNLKTPTALFAR